MEAFTIPITVTNVTKTTMTSSNAIHEKIKNVQGGWHKYNLSGPCQKNVTAALLSKNIQFKLDAYTNVIQLLH